MTDVIRIFGTVATLTRLSPHSQKTAYFANPDTYPGIGELFRTFGSSCSMLVKLSPGWSPTTGKLPALTPARGWMAARLLDVPLLLRELPSLRLREIKLYQITAILTDSR